VGAVLASLAAPGNANAATDAASALAATPTLPTIAAELAVHDRVMTPRRTRTPQRQILQTTRDSVSDETATYAVDTATGPYRAGSSQASAGAPPLLTSSSVHSNGFAAATAPFASSRGRRIVLASPEPWTGPASNLKPTDAHSVSVSPSRRLTPCRPGGDSAAAVASSVRASSVQLSHSRRWEFAGPASSMASPARAVSAAVRPARHSSDRPNVDPRRRRFRTANVGPVVVPDGQSNSSFIPAPPSSAPAGSFRPRRPGAVSSSSKDRPTAPKRPRRPYGANRPQVDNTTALREQSLAETARSIVNGDVFALAASADHADLRRSTHGSAMHAAASQLIIDAGTAQATFAQWFGAPLALQHAEAVRNASRSASVRAGRAVWSPHRQLSSQAA
jgi:hypothetical protein